MSETPIEAAFRAGWIAGRAAGAASDPDAAITRYVFGVAIPPTPEDLDVFRNFIERDRGARNPLTLEALKRLVDAWS